MCHGTGVDRQDASLCSPFVEWSNANAKIMFELLHLSMGEDGFGTLSLGKAMLHLQRARTALEFGQGEELERPSELEMGISGNAIAPRFLSKGLDVEGMTKRLNDLEKFLEEAESFGCQEITWS